jgi:hypothetical protein
MVKNVRELTFSLYQMPPFFSRAANQKSGIEKKRKPKKVVVWSKMMYCLTALRMPVTIASARAMNTDASTSRSVTTNAPLSSVEMVRPAALAGPK